MKFNTDNASSIEQVGEIKKNGVSIDTSNIDFLVTILSTNLYSNPIESFIRETVSNAWDSHVEAGVTDPVILELGQDTEGANFCRIQDFGVGLSPERFDKIYRNIGSSTKRDTNGQIGGFGIGRFSALAYSEVVHITSNFDNVKYKYMMYKDGNSISIDLLYEGATTEKNGLEVMVSLKNSDIFSFAKAIEKQLVYFENLYVIDSSGITDVEHNFNNFVIKRYNNFNVNTLDGSSSKINLTLGKVRYPLRIESLDKLYPKYVGDYPISLNFDIGDLEVTPNREEILYSKKNVATIEDRLDAAVKEVQTLIDSESNKDFTSLVEYMKVLQESHKLILLEKDHQQVYIKIPKQKLNVTLEGKHYDKDSFLGMYSMIMDHRGITSNYTMNNYKINYSRVSINLNTIKNNIDKVYVSDLGTVKNITKAYIRENLDNGSFFIKFDSLKTYYRGYVKHIKRAVKNRSSYSNDSWKYDPEISKVILKYLVKSIKSLKKFNDSSVPKQWIIDKKQEAKDKRVNARKDGIDWKQHINLYRLRKSDRGYMSISADSEAFKLDELSTNFKKLTVYGEKGDVDLRALYITARRHVNCVEVAPTKMKLLKKVENFVEIDDFMDLDYKLIRNIGTAEYINKKLPFLTQLNCIDNLSIISEKVGGLVDELYRFQRMYSSDFNGRDESQEKLVEEIYQLCEDNNYFNEEIRSKVVDNFTMLENAQCLMYFADHKYGRRNIPDDKLNIAVDYILARKLFRPNIPAVFKLKKETIFNNKIEEDENN